jgi:hypothetical protein
VEQLLAAGGDVAEAGPPQGRRRASEHNETRIVKHARRAFAPTAFAATELSRASVKEHPRLEPLRQRAMRARSPSAAFFAGERIDCGPPVVCVAWDPCACVAHVARWSGSMRSNNSSRTSAMCADITLASSASPSGVRRSTTARSSSVVRRVARRWQCLHDRQTSHLRNFAATRGPDVC